MGEKYMQGLFAVFGDRDCRETVFSGTFGLQYRGQVYGGLTTTNGEKIKIRTHRGLFEPMFKDDLGGMEGFAGLGVTSSIDRQPFYMDSTFGEYSTGADCCIKNHDDLRSIQYSKGHSFTTHTDVELIAKLIGENHNIGGGIKYALDQIAGPCNIVLLSCDGIYAGRDYHGFKPLCIGEKEGQWAISSATCSLNRCGFDYVRDVEPGEVIFIGENGLVTLYKPEKPHKLNRCSFEWIYFEEPDSEVFGIPVTEVRHNLGANLAKADEKEFNFSPENTVVGPVPNSGNAHAEGYHLYSKLPSLALFKPPKYVLRTYNLPLEQRKREKSRKLSTIKVNVKGKIIVLVDDSIRSAITITGIVQMLFKDGALEVHVRIACPNSIRYCMFDYPPSEEEEFIAATKSVEEICQIIGATSLRFQMLEDVPEAIGLDADTLCLECFKKN